MLRTKKLQDLVHELVHNSNKERPRFLDVGCGTGSFYDDVGNVIPKEAPLYGIDISSKMLREGLKRHKTQHFRWAVSFVQGDAEFLPFRDRTFEVVTSLYTLHCVPNKDRAIQ